MTVWKTYLQTHQDQFLAELSDFLRIPSISSLPEHKDDVQRGAEWVANRLNIAGLENVEIMPTGGHPVVYADWLHAPGKPTVMIYGHFDVQPVDPLHLWTNPPFEPFIENDRIYGRGATDDKGNMLIPILALEALLKTEGKLPLNIKCFFEGQEEIGSPQLTDFVNRYDEKFACDLVVSADGGQWDEQTPNLIVGLKGLTPLQIDVEGANSDVHSGLHGGVIQNPIHALIRILDSMRAPDGLITVDGFYDNVVPLSEDDRAKIAAVPFNRKAYMAELGVNGLFGEPGYTARERGWARPTLEINGIWGGFQGEGTKTIVPNEAHAKITCRLVANQTPVEIAALITTHVILNAPPGIKVSINSLEGSAYPYLMPAEHPGNQAAHAVLEALYGKAPYYIRMGGSIPVCALFLRKLKAYTVNFAFALNDENLHAPDEFFRLSNFRRGQEAYVLLLNKLANTLKVKD